LQVAAKDLVPVPDILAMRRVVAFSPHPDDNEIGAAGTLARLIEMGAEVTWVVASDGAMGSFDDETAAGIVETRRQEQESAMAIVGGSRLEWLGFRDMTLARHEEELESRVYAAIRRLKPDLVMAPDPWCPYEAHPDHRALGRVVATAAIMAAFPLVHPEAGPAVDTPSVAFYATAWPNTRVDITETFDRKVQAIRAHASQFPGMQADLITFYLRTRAGELGAESGVELAEAFKVLSPFHLHFYPDAWQS
jgi:LmbE family N-acetylglucosaminyl deacetylase